MSQENSQSAAQKKTQTVLDGPLKHARAAALAAALVPLASIAATPAHAQTGGCPSAGVCGVVFADTNNNGLQDPGEGVIEGAVVTLATTPQGDLTTSTGPDGVYYFAVPNGDYEISVQIPPGTQASPANVGNDDTIDSDGVPDGFGESVATVTFTGSEDMDTDFGFWTPSVQQPGTGTPGYWKNHPDAWPVQSIIVGGVTYTKAQALTLLDTPGKDKTLTMFSSLVPAMLNVLVGNDSSCVSIAIGKANTWMATYGPVGSNVAASSAAWTEGKVWHEQMDAYNNGLLCAPHRQ